MNRPQSRRLFSPFDDDEHDRMEAKGPSIDVFAFDIDADATGKYIFATGAESVGLEIGHLLGDETHSGEVFYVMGSYGWIRASALGSRGGDHRKRWCA